MADRVKRSVSVPADLDGAIQAAAERAGMTYSGWVAYAAGRALRIESGLAAVTQYEAEHGAFTSDELAAADAWIDKMESHANPASGAA